MDLRLVSNMGLINVSLLQTGGLKEVGSSAPTGKVKVTYIVSGHFAKNWKVP